MTPNKKVLVVDDDMDMRDTLADVLTDEGYFVETAPDGLEALALLQREPKPSMILLDWMMPRCNGLQFRERQRADPTVAQIPVVLLTADARVEEKQEVLGADASLLKPVRLEQLLAVVAKYCG